MAYCFVLVRILRAVSSRYSSDMRAVSSQQTRSWCGCSRFTVKCICCIAYAIDSGLVLSCEDMQVLPYVTDSDQSRAIDMPALSLRSNVIVLNIGSEFKHNAVK